MDFSSSKKRSEDEEHHHSVEPVADVDRTSTTSSVSTQAGVKRIEAVSQAWTKWGLISAYVGIFLMACSTSLEQQTVATLSVYATSSFAKHSLVATVLVIQGVVQAVVKPPMAKIADAFGRLEAFSIAIALYVAGYVQQAASKNVQTYAAAQIFYSSGSTALQILQQVFIADTSDLLNRALWSTLPDVPFLATVWIGPEIGSSILKRSTWRWGYGIWAIVLPIAFLPFALSLFLNLRRAARLNLLPPSPFKKTSLQSKVSLVWYELDIFGILLLSAGLALVLLPLTLAATAKGRWKNGSIIAMLVVGCVSLVAFPLWDTNKKVAPHPLLTLRLFRNRTVVAGCALAFFYFMAFYLSVQPYFYSYLQVVQHQSVVTAGHVTQVFSFTATVSSIVVSLLIKYTRHYKYFVLAGSLIYILGIGLMIRYRTADATVAQDVGVQIAVGIGGGMLNVPAQLGVQASASHQEVAAATALFLLFLEVGGAVGAAISGAIWTANIPKKLQEYLPESAKADALKIFGDITVATSYKVGSPERLAIDRAYQETMNKLLIAAVVVCIPLIPLALMMKNYKLDEMDQKVKGKVIGTMNSENRNLYVDYGSCSNSTRGSQDEHHPGEANGVQVGK
ncbi:MAG: hypothetical protein M1814_005243 [Vezdaea aestivalis]|nr:MAG: hypothetical protein M1814_005243 [Vezdaea aestivalis]